MVDRFTIYIRQNTDCCCFCTTENATGKNVRPNIEVCVYQLYRKTNIMESMDTYEIYGIPK